MIYWRRLKSPMEKIYFGNIQQTRLLDDEVAESVKTCMSFRHIFDYQIVGSKSNLPSKENVGIYTGMVYFAKAWCNI